MSRLKTAIGGHFFRSWVRCSLCLVEAVGRLLFGEFQGAWTQISVGILGENTPMAALLHWHDPLKERPQSGAKGGKFSVSKT